jgi:hypothetical protein
MKLVDVIVGRARQGDRDELIQYIREGHPLTKEMPKFIIEVLQISEGLRPKNEKNKQGIRRGEKRYRDMRIAAYVDAVVRGDEKLETISPDDDQAQREKKAGDAAAKEFKVDVRTVKRALEAQGGRWPHSLYLNPARATTVGALSHERCNYCPEAAAELKQFDDVVCPYCRLPRGFPDINIG